MARRAARSRDGRTLECLIEIVDEVAGKTAARTATSRDHAVARVALRFLLATTSLVEVGLAGQLSEPDLTAINWIRHACARYEAMLWQPAPIFLRS